MDGAHEKGSQQWMQLKRVDWTVHAVVGQVNDTCFLMISVPQTLVPVAREWSQLGLNSNFSKHCDPFSFDLKTKYR